MHSSKYTRHLAELPSKKKVFMAGVIFAIGLTLYQLLHQEPGLNPHVSFRNGWKVRKVCESQLQVVFMFITSAGNVEHRNLLRSTLGRTDIRKLLNSTLLFVVGRTESQIINEAVQNESLLNGDMVVLPVRDTYKNLTLKWIHGIRWAIAHCGDSAKFIVKIDDDMLVNVYRFRDWIRTHLNATPGLWCRIYNNTKPIRDARSKWYVSPQEYAPSIYPDYCVGWAYIMPTAVAGILSEASEVVPLFWVEDVYFTGLLSRAAEVPLNDMTRYYTYFARGRPEVIKKDTIFIHTGGIRNITRRRLWFRLLTDKTLR